MPSIIKPNINNRLASTDKDKNMAPTGCGRIRRLGGTLTSQVAALGEGDPQVGVVSAKRIR